MYWLPQLQTARRRQGLPGTVTNPYPTVPAAVPLVAPASSSQQPSPSAPLVEAPTDMLEDRTHLPAWCPAGWRAKWSERRQQPYFFRVNSSGGAYERNKSGKP